MRIRHLIEADRKKMGRDLNHIEDLVFFYGSDGAQEALEILQDLTDDDRHDLSIKWDGKVALFYGRDEDGVFGMGTKGNWAKNMPMTSPEAAYEYITTAGKGEDWRKEMGRDFIKIFPILENSVPQNFSGYVTGDLIFSPVLAPKKKTPEGIQFKSNQVVYTVDPQSELGKRVAQAEVGMALHLKFDSWNSSNKAVIGQDTVKQLNSPQVLALGQTYAPSAPRLDDSVLKKLSSMIQKNGHLIDRLIERRAGLSDIPNIIYTFNNQMTRAGKANDVSTQEFFEWLSGSKVSANKQAKLAAINEENPRAFPALFELVRAVAEAKNNIIDQLEAATTDIRASTDGQAGGEGYVSLKHKVKLVPRHRWRPS